MAAKKQARDRVKWCRHHVKDEPMVDKCAIGVDVESLCGKFGNFGRFYRLPCHDAPHSEITRCVCPVGGPEWFTEEEIAQQDAEIAADMDAVERRINAVSPLCRRIKSGIALSGSDPCPACGEGEVHWSKSSWNGHVAMRCSTADCINFME